MYGNGKGQMKLNLLMIAGALPGVVLALLALKWMNIQGFWIGIIVPAVAGTMTWLLFLGIWLWFVCRKSAKKNKSDQSEPPPK